MDDVSVLEEIKMRNFNSRIGKSSSRVTKAKKEYTLASSSKCKDGKLFESESDAYSWCQEQVRKGASQAGIAGSKVSEEQAKKYWKKKDIIKESNVEHGFIPKCDDKEAQRIAQRKKHYPYGDD